MFAWGQVENAYRSPNDEWNIRVCMFFSFSTLHVSASMKCFLIFSIFGPTDLHCVVEMSLPDIDGLSELWPQWYNYSISLDGAQLISNILLASNCLPRFVPVVMVMRGACHLGNQWRRPTEWCWHETIEVFLVRILMYVDSNTSWPGRSKSKGRGPRRWQGLCLETSMLAAPCMEEIVHHIGFLIVCSPYSLALESMQL